jgi:hypothetical protein
VADAVLGQAKQRQLRVSGATSEILEGGVLLQDLLV